MNTPKCNFDNSVNAARPTIQDVAKLAGVSIATVSHVINNKGAVGEVTRQKIRLLIMSIAARGASLVGSNLGPTVSEQGLKPANKTYASS